MSIFYYICPWEIRHVNFMTVKIIPPVGTLTGLGVVSAATEGFGGGVTISTGGTGGDPGMGSGTGGAVDPGPLRASSPSASSLSDSSEVWLSSSSCDCVRLFRNMM